MRNPAFLRPPAASSSGTGSRLKSGAAAPSVEAFLPALLLLVAVATGFLAQAGGGRIPELLVAAGAVVLACLTRWRTGVAAAVAALAAFLAIEYHYGRLDQDHYWELVLYVFGIAGAVISSAYIRFAISAQRARLERAQARTQEATAEASLEALLLAGSRLGALEYELDRSRRHSHRFALLIVRPDAVATLGEDEELPLEVLRPIAERVGTQIRAIDVAFRTGRHDFCIILPETPPEGARVAAERIRLSLAGTNVPLQDGRIVDLAVSVGIAVFPDDTPHNDALVDAAAAAVEHARELGGNRTVMQSAPAGSPRGWVLNRRQPARA